MDSHRGSEAKTAKKWIPTAGWRTEFVDSRSRSDAKTEKVDPTAGRRTELVDSNSSSNDRIGDFPQ